MNSVLLFRTDRVGDFLLSLSLIKIIKSNYPNSKIVGHSKAVVTKKTCPNFDVKAWCVKREMPYAFD